MVKRKSAPASAISKTMLIADIVALCPEAKDVLAEYGLHCIGCAGNAFETLREGCAGHGFSDEEIDELVDDLNTMIDELPDKPKTLTVTLAAAHAIKGVAEQEKRTGEGLAVIVDGQGGFCMEFRKEPTNDEQTFFHREAPDVRIFASTLTLKRIGGSTIDFRDGRFKLDLSEQEAACGCGGECGCKQK